MTILIVLILVSLAGCSRQPAHTNEVVSIPVSEAPLNPTDSAWNQAPVHIAELLMQDLVEPRLMKASTPDIQVRSLNNGTEIAFRLEWNDSSLNDLPGPGRFFDACAIQLQSRIEANAPDPQMGTHAQPVEITFWRADWQASVKGRPDTIQSLFPNATSDHYPFEAKALEPGSAAQREMAKRYAPAEASGNRRVGPRRSPVEDLIAEGPGSLRPDPNGTSHGQAERGSNGWSVVLKRRYPQGLTPKVRTQIAFAVWEGSAKEVGARKMRSGWIPLAVREQMP